MCVQHREAIRLYILLDMESGEELGGSEETREGGGPDSTQLVCKHWLPKSKKKFQTWRSHKWSRNVAILWFTGNTTQDACKSLSWIQH